MDKGRKWIFRNRFREWFGILRNYISKCMGKYYFLIYDDRKLVIYVENFYIYIKLKLIIFYNIKFFWFSIGKEFKLYIYKWCYWF